MNNLIDQYNLPHNAVEILFCSENPPKEFLNEINQLCKQENIHFETWAEMFFLRLIRVEEDDHKIISLANNLDKLPNGKNINKIFYEIILNNFICDIHKQYVYEILKLNSSYDFLIEALCKQEPIKICSMISNLENHNVALSENIYASVLTSNNFSSIQKFNYFFSLINDSLKTKIFIRASELKDYSLLSRIDSFLYDKSFFHNWINLCDFDKLINNCEPEVFMGTLMHTRNYLFYNIKLYQDVLLKLIEKSAVKDYSDFPIKAGNFISKRLIVDILINKNSLKVLDSFIEKFSDDPEIEHLTIFV